jgi:hypothetical protein
MSYYFDVQKTDISQPVDMVSGREHHLLYNKLIAQCISCIKIGIYSRVITTRCIIYCKLFNPLEFTEVLHPCYRIITNEQ